MGGIFFQKVPPTNPNPFKSTAGEGGDAVGEERHDRAGDEDACEGGEEGFFGIELEDGGDEGTRPRACSRERHGNEDHNTEVGILFDLLFVLFDLIFEPIADAREEFDAAFGEIIEDGTDKDQDKGHGQEISRRAEQEGLPPRKSEGKAERNCSAALDDGQERAEKDAKLFPNGLQEKGFDRFNHRCFFPFLTFLYVRAYLRNTRKMTTSEAVMMTTATDVTIAVRRTSRLLAVGSSAMGREEARINPICFKILESGL